MLVNLVISLSKCFYHFGLGKILDIFFLFYYFIQHQFTPFSFYAICFLLPIRTAQNKSNVHLLSMLSNQTDLNIFTFSRFQESCSLTTWNSIKIMIWHESLDDDANKYFTVLPLERNESASFLWCLASVSTSPPIWHRRVCLFFLSLEPYFSCILIRKLLLLHFWILICSGDVYLSYFPRTQFCCYYWFSSLLSNTVHCRLSVDRQRCGCL